MGEIPLMQKVLSRIHIRGGAPQRIRGFSNRQLTANFDRSNCERNRMLPSTTQLLRIKRPLSTDETVFFLLRDIKNRGCSSSGRAPPLQGGGRGFESPQLHHPTLRLRPPNVTPHFLRRVISVYKEILEVGGFSFVQDVSTPSGLACQQRSPVFLLYLTRLSR